MNIEISPLNIYLALSLNGLATGIGSTIGSYLVTKYLLKNSERLVKKLRRKRNG